MSLSSPESGAPAQAGSAPGGAGRARADAGGQAAVALAALALVGLAMVGLSLLWSAGSPPPPPPRSPFGISPREAAPSASGLGGQLLIWQSMFYRELTGALRAVRESPAALAGLIWLGFAYGALHAAGPGHGKAVISAYILSDDRAAALRGFALSLGAALVQAAVAIALVLTLRLALGATAAQMGSATRGIELASFAAVLALGLAVLWRKAGLFVAARRGEAEACAPGCGHDAAALPAPRSPAQAVMVVLAAGIRPCAGAIIILVFAMSQAMLWAGVAATLAMALGTALTTGALALLAVGAKRTALALAGGRGQGAALAIRALECLAAAFLAVLGAVLLFGVWTAGPG